MKSPFKKVIGIDPGKGGGIAVITDETVQLHNCPKTVDSMAHLIGHWRQEEIQGHSSQI